MKFTTFYVLLHFLVLSSIAQNKSVGIYGFKSDWSSTSNLQTAVYFAYVTKENDTTYVSRFYQNQGPMVRLETCKDAAFQIPNGLFIWYNKAGKLDSMGYVVNGLKNGKWEHYGDSSHSMITVEYNSGRFVKAVNKITKKIYYADGREEDLIKPAKVSSAIDDTAKKKITTITYTPASFENGIREWQAYLGRNLKTPERLQTILRNQGVNKATVFANYNIDKEGNIANIIIDQSFEWSADMEVIRVLKASPKWKPAVQNTHNVVFRNRQGFTFVID